MPKHVSGMRYKVCPLSLSPIFLALVHLNLYFCTLLSKVGMHYKLGTWLAFWIFLKLKILWHFLYLLRHFQLKWPKSEEFFIFEGGLACLCYFFSGTWHKSSTEYLLPPSNCELHNLHSPNIEKNHKNWQV